MIAAEFEHHSPRDLAQLIDLLGEAAGEARVLAGGMTLVPMLNLSLATPTRVISLRDVDELKGVSERSGSITIGAMTRHFTIANDPLLKRYAPLLCLAAGLIGDVQVRNRGTIGGSLAHADPAANYLPAVIALDAQLALAGPRGTRVVPAREFFRDTMTTVLGDGEIIVSVNIAKGNAIHGSGFQKFARVKGNFPIVCAAALVDGSPIAAKVAIGGATPVPVLLHLPPERSTARMLDALVGSIRGSLSNVLEDQNGDADYKREMAVVFATRALTDALRDRERKESWHGQ